MNTSYFINKKRKQFIVEELKFLKICKTDYISNNIIRIDNNCFSKCEDIDFETLAPNTHTLLRRLRFQRNDSDFH